MRILILAAAALSALALCQCSPKTDTAASGSAAASVSAPSFAYDVDLDLTPAALAAVQAKKQKVTVSVMYYGNVTPASQALADPKDGTLHLDTDVVEVDPAGHQTVHMTGAGANVPHLKDITGQKPLALLIVYAGKSPDTSSIRCTDFQDYVATAQQSPVTLKCDAA